jgi:hypothetical protein
MANLFKCKPALPVYQVGARVEMVAETAARYARFGTVEHFSPAETRQYLIRYADGTCSRSHISDIVGNASEENAPS